MTTDHGVRVLLGLCAAVLVGIALHLGQAIFAPVVFALFVIALVWPVQRAAEARLPQGLAVVVTVLVTLVAVALLAAAIAWAFGRVAEWVLANAARLQRLFASKLEWFDRQGIEAAGPLAEQFDLRWLVRIAQGVLAQLQTIISFAVVTSVFTILGLLEVEQAAAQLAALKDSPAAQRLLAGLALGGRSSGATWWCAASPRC